MCLFPRQRQQVYDVSPRHAQPTRVRGLTPPLLPEVSAHPLEAVRRSESTRASDAEKSARKN